MVIQSISKKALVSLLLLISIIGSSNAQWVAPVKNHGALKVVNGKIVDVNNVPSQLRGISLSWSIWQGQKYYNTEVIDWLIKDFKISLLRVSMAIQHDGGYLQQPEQQYALITKVIDHALAKGIYVLIDWHDHNAEQHLEESKGFFDKVAKRYADKPNIIYEIWNEPERQTWPAIKAYAVDVIKTIRKNDPNKLIVVGSSSWDQDVDIASKDPITSFNNTAYSFHFYASDPNHNEMLRARADLAIKNGLALFVTEWGVGEANGDGEFNRVKTNEWLNWMESNKLSWANWNITDKKETTALLMPGAPVNGNWTTDQLTDAGKYIREKLRELNGF
ncbi:glycoside hydrolase family 5 protein [Solitalea canadensis]|uniref:Endoglucanase n=1 Tax=Solitalea canadensis (strain ATCC 29591 / DSM 3403 / JCM 21819 / LMG 8368 / NBRC 15130 / NCIMB 12057 / USAM 9D) TaxID=929556 RepID=H8KUQ2_SOLCM|nr:glycoside hydrolase family 5 protein [Solitalea canadensis]AFD07536.1 endoglucanase [Solitalea canadensis DSM 3403]